MADNLDEPYSAVAAGQIGGAVGAPGRAAVPAPSLDDARPLLHAAAGWSGRASCCARPTCRSSTWRSPPASPRIPISRRATACSSAARRRGAPHDILSDRQLPRLLRLFSGLSAQRPSDSLAPLDLAKRRRQSKNDGDRAVHARHGDGARSARQPRWPPTRRSSSSTPPARCGARSTASRSSRSPARRCVPCCNRCRPTSNSASWPMAIARRAIAPTSS